MRIHQFPALPTPNRIRPTHTRIAAVALAVVTGLSVQACSADANQESPAEYNTSARSYDRYTIINDLSRIAVKGRAPKTGYSRDQFGDGWNSTQGCDTRNRILKRDLTDITYDTKGCKVITGTLHDPYTAKTIAFTRGQTTSSDIQIDHAVALSDAWQTGAQSLSSGRRIELANDPLNLQATDGPTNEAKGDADAASWLPPNKSFRCSYVAKQVLVKQEYDLWVTPAEHDAMKIVLNGCTDTIPVIV